MSRMSEPTQPPAPFSIAPAETSPIKTQRGAEVKPLVLPARERAFQERATLLNKLTLFLREALDEALVSKDLKLAALARSLTLTAQERPYPRLLLGQHTYCYIIIDAERGDFQIRRYAYTPLDFEELMDKWFKEFGIQDQHIAENRFIRPSAL